MYLSKNTSALDNDALRQAAPSIFAAQAFAGVSSRYGFIPTIRVIDAMRSEGWLPVRANEARCRLEEKKGFTRHVVRFRRADAAPVAVGDSVAEVVLLNSHDASGAYQMHAGFFRLVCSNGLVVSDGSFERLSIRHSGDVVGRVIEGAARVVAETPRLVENVGAMRAVTLSDGERQAFAAAALPLRYEDTAPIAAADLLRTHRTADQGADLWTTFNVVQENLLRGGVRGRTAAGKRTRTREVTSISEDTRLNKALWTLADELRKLKAA